MTTLEFLPLAVNPGDYPKPRLSMLPSCACVAWLGGKPRNMQSAFLSQQDFFVFGRYALVEALKRAGVGPGKAVLLPAYHCRTIVESVLHLGAEARFYSMQENLKPDFVSLKKLIADGTVRAVLLTHYFGFPNALIETKQFCDNVGVRLIEDCAHAFYGEHEGHVLGTVGDYAVASAWKYLPLRDGAFLRDNTPQQRASVRLKRASLNCELKALIGALKTWFLREGKPSKLPAVDFESLTEHALEVASYPKVVIHPLEVQFHPHQVEMSGLRFSRWLVSHANHQRVIERRRENYLYWLKCIADIPAVKPLFSTLPDGVTPYAFPLITDSAGLAFHLLKLAGVPIWRWEDVVKTECEVSQNYRLRLLQLPCHQDLTKAQIDWIVEILRGALPRLYIKQSTNNPTLP